MQPQFDNKLITSFLLLVDHELLKRGLAYTNTSGQLYRISSNLTNAIAYASPVKGWVNDTSISGATVASGVYVNGHFVTIGQSGLDSINHYQGVAYFTGVNFLNSTTVTAAYSVKEFNVSMVDQR
jgi:hypothetical protein